MLSREQQREYLLSKKGNTVKFNYPESGSGKIGVLMDRVVWFDEEDENVAYWNVVDLICFEGENEPWLRITYYRYKKPQGNWVFAGQTSISDPISRMVKFFSDAARAKWFRGVIEDALKSADIEHGI